MDTVATTVSRNNLFGKDYPQRIKGGTLAQNQTGLIGWVLGKILVAAGTAAAGGTNTGDGAVSAFALLASKVPLVGTYVAKCISAVVDGGVFAVVNPLGETVGTFIAGTTFSGAGITFAVSVGDTDFVVGDYFDLPVEAGSGQLKLLDKTATDGSQKFEGVLVAERTTGTGETTPAPYAYVGSFQEQALIFASGTVLADVIDDMNAKDCFVDASDADENLTSGV